MPTGHILLKNEIHMHIKEHMDKLADFINQANKAYYEKGESLTSDLEFDMKLKELEKLEKQNPEFKRSDSPTAKVGSDLTPGFEKVAHEVPMLSIQNCYDYQELDDFGKQVTSALNSSVDYTIEFKIDGVSLSLIYVDRKLVTAVTRGDGAHGDDVTENARTITDIPLELPEGSPEGRVEVRGEVYLSRKRFESLNKRLQSSGKPVLQNPRNATSGTIKTKDVVEVGKRGLKFFAFNIVGASSKSTHKENLKWLESMGFTPSPYKQVKDLDQAKKVIEAMDGRRASLDYDIDGMVIKVNSISAQQKLGATSKHPRWLAAWKYKAEAAQTTILSVDYQVGRTGRITPVANLEPVRLAGTTVKRATLHNFDEIDRLGARVGDLISIEKGGEIIPKITKVVKDNGGSPIERIKECPACGSELEEGEDVDIRCTNMECPPQLQRGIEHFVSRNAMNIDAVGPALIKQLIDAGMIKTSALDLFELKEVSMLGLERMASKSVKKVLKSIEDSKNNSPERLLTALGIRHFGKTASKALVENVENLQDFLSSDPSDQLSRLEGIEGIGSVSASSFVKYWEDRPGLLEKIVDLSLNLVYEKEEKSNQFAGETVVLTGTLPNYKRPEMGKMIEKAGGKVSGSISSKTTILVAGENAGSKLEKAKSLGVAIYSEQDVLDRLNA
jgi:DNA ligase (NAD+)